MRQSNVILSSIASASILGALGCISTTPLQPRSVAPDEGGMFGRIEVFNQGAEVTDRCGAIFMDEHDEPKGGSPLAGGGWVFLAVKTGPTLLAEVNCALGSGLGNYLASYKGRGLKFEVPGQGKLAYFGHVKVDMSSEGTGVAAATVLFGALGNALASAGEGENGQATILNEFLPAKAEYASRFGAEARSLVPIVSIAGDPRPLTEQNRRDQLQSDEPPANVLGFKLGDGIGGAEVSCTSAGLVWTKVDESRASCARTPLDPGLPVKAEVKVCGDALFQVLVDANPDGVMWDPLKDRFVKLTKVLAETHGAPHQRDTKLFDDCSGGPAKCFAQGRARTTMKWQWRDGQKVQITLDGGSPEGRPTLTVVAELRAKSEAAAQCP